MDALVLVLSQVGIAADCGRIIVSCGDYEDMVRWWRVQDALRYLKPASDKWLSSPVPVPLSFAPPRPRRKNGKALVQFQAKAPVCLHTGPVRLVKTIAMPHTHQHQFRMILRTEDARLRQLLGSMWASARQWFGPASIAQDRTWRNIRATSPSLHERPVSRPESQTVDLPYERETISFVDGSVLDNVVLHCTGANESTGLHLAVQGFTLGQCVYDLCRIQY